MYCSRPNIILNKSLANILNKFGRRCVFTDGSSIYPLHGRLPSPSSVGATLENYKNWNVLTEDGELIPLFTPVPCGKCLLCRDKKAKEWSTRATCEGVTATYPPIFITLTYSDEYLPEDGVNKEHLQKFIKRFRENWCRMYQADRLDLRYFAVSEYGTKYGRPHYHLLMWNVPNYGKDDLLSLRKIDACVSRSWSELCEVSEYKNLLEMHQFTFEGRFYKKFGRTEVTADRGNSGSYCMKYMRKPQDVPSRWSQPTFYLSSRRGGGIGMRYLNNIIDSIRTQEPAMTKLPTPVGEFSLPRCFKEKIFPSLSMIIPTHIRCQLVRFDKIITKLLPLNVAHNDEIHRYEMLKSMRDSLRQHYGCAYDYIIKSEHLYHESDELITLPKGYYNNNIRDELYLKASLSFIQCYEWQPDNKRLDYFVQLREKRKEIMDKMTFLDVDVSAEHYRILKRMDLNKLREVF